MNMMDESKLRSPVRSTFEALVVRRVCDVWSGIVVEKNWGHSADQCRLHVLQCSVHLIDLLSIPLRWNGFTGIQKAIVDQTGSSPPAVTMTFSFGASLALGSDLYLLLSPATELVITSYCVKSTFNCRSQSDREVVRRCGTE